jgi:hypothetical protein
MPELSIHAVYQYGRAPPAGAARVAMRVRCLSKEEDTGLRLKRGHYLLVGSKEGVTCLSAQKRELHACRLERRTLACWTGKMEIVLRCRAEGRSSGRQSMRAAVAWKWNCPLHPWCCLCRSAETNGGQSGGRCSKGLGSVHFSSLEPRV